MNHTNKVADFWWLEMHALEDAIMRFPVTYMANFSPKMIMKSADGNVISN
jgi:hypothetical protein